MTTPAATQQPVEQPQPTSTASISALAAALWQANTQQDTINILVWLLLLDVPTATHLIAIIWHVTPSNPRPWRKTPSSVAAHMQAGYVQNAAQRIRDAVAETERNVAQAQTAGERERPSQRPRPGSTVAGEAERVRTDTESTATQEAGKPVPVAETPQQALARALQREQYFAQLHRRAQARRATAFVASKHMQRRYGRIVGWKTTIDKRTSRACALADGANYDAVTGPWPGTLHGGTCRCRPTAPHPNAPMVTDVWRRHGLTEHAEGAA